MLSILSFKNFFFFLLFSALPFLALSHKTQSSPFLIFFTSSSNFTPFLHMLQHPPCHPIYLPVILMHTLQRGMLTCCFCESAAFYDSIECIIYALALTVLLLSPSQIEYSVLRASSEKPRDLATFLFSSTSFSSKFGDVSSFQSQASLRNARISFLLSDSRTQFQTLIVTLAPLIHEPLPHCNSALI